MWEVVVCIPAGDGEISQAVSYLTMEVIWLWTQPKNFAEICQTAVRLDAALRQAKPAKPSRSRLSPTFLLTHTQEWFKK